MPALRRWAAGAALLAALLALSGCGRREPAPAAIDYQPVDFTTLEGWAADDPTIALAAFRRSCAKLQAKAPDKSMTAEPLLGRVGDWLPACTAATEPALATDPAAARAFFETWFQPYRITGGDPPDGLFTGYYEPLLHGSRQRHGRYTVPLHTVPRDLIRVDLGRFSPKLAGEAIYGRINGNDFEPYFARAEIEAGALADQQLELFWVDDQIAKFFMQIQGSGQVRLDDGSVVRLGYASQNGKPYRAIGRDLVEMGALRKEEVSLQTIRSWLLANPAAAPALMAKNPSYVFFQENRALSAADGPLGAQGVSLSPERSIAVDPRFVPYGAPVWLETTAPLPEGEAAWHRLLIAQDTGGAIKGAVRGDVYWGAGERAEAIAGRMKSPGRWFVLVPKSVVPTS